MVQPEVIRRPPRPSWDSFASTRTPRCHHVSSIPPRNLCPGFEAQTRKPVHPMVLRTKPSNRSWVAYSIRVPRNSTRVTAVLDWPSAKSSWAPLDSNVRRLDSVNTVTSMYTCACRCLRCQPPQLVTRPPSPLVQASRLFFTALGPSARHVSTWPSPRGRPPSPSSTPAHHKPRDMSHNPTHAMVSHKLNLSRGSRW
jgi:hypothetical protein